jgi:hypothetical protein
VCSCIGGEGGGGEAEGRGEAGRDAVVVLKSQRPSIFTKKKYLLKKKPLHYEADCRGIKAGGKAASDAAIKNTNEKYQ